MSTNNTCGYCGYDLEDCYCPFGHQANQVSNLTELRQQLHTKILRAAELHGINSDPDHEVGDLQDVLKLALQLMTAYQLQKLEEAIPRNVYTYADVTEWDLAQQDL